MTLKQAQKLKTGVKLLYICPLNKKNREIFRFGKLKYEPEFKQYYVSLLDHPTHGYYLRAIKTLSKLEKLLYEQ